MLTIQLLSFAEDNVVFLFFPHLLGRPDVVNLEDHLDELAGEEDLRLLAVEALDHVLLLHIEVPGAHAVDAEGGVLLRHLKKIIYFIKFA